MKKIVLLEAFSYGIISLHNLCSKLFSGSVWQDRKTACNSQK